MNYCGVCDKPKEELARCNYCSQDVCLSCLASRTHLNLVDENVCKTCYDNSLEL